MRWCSFCERNLLAAKTFALEDGLVELEFHQYRSRCFWVLFFGTYVEEIDWIMSLSKANFIAKSGNEIERNRRLGQCSMAKMTPWPGVWQNFPSIAVGLSIVLNCTGTKLDTI